VTVEAVAQLKVKSDPVSIPHRSRTIPYQEADEREGLIAW